MKEKAFFRVSQPRCSSILKFLAKDIKYKEKCKEDTDSIEGHGLGGEVRITATDDAAYLIAALPPVELQALERAAWFKGRNKEEQ